MSNFYTNVWMEKGKVYCKGYTAKGAPFFIKRTPTPYVFIRDNGESDETFVTLDNKPVRRKKFASTYEAYGFLERFKDVDGLQVYGTNRWLYQWVNDNFPGELLPDTSHVRVGYLDIEVESDGPFEPAIRAQKKIISITLRHKTTNYVWGLKEFDSSKVEGTIYFQCSTEKQMLNSFLDIWKQLDLDVISGWNVEQYDMVYLTTRLGIVLGDHGPALLCKHGRPKYRKIKQGFHEVDLVTIPGITILDFMILYKKYVRSSEESFKLDFIAEKVLKQNKLDYSEYGSLHNLYVNDHQKFIEYNIQDAVLVAKMEETLQLIVLVMTMAYICKVSYTDAMGTVTKWDVLTHNYLLERGIVVPWNNIDVAEEESAVGGFVKEPQKGKHKWIVTFDVASLYPSLIRQCNISPERLVGQIPDVTIEDMLDCTVRTPSKNFDEIRETLLQHNAGLCSSGCVFSNKIQGFYPALMELYFNKRKFYKDKAKIAKTKISDIQSKLAQTPNDSKLISLLSKAEEEFNVNNILQQAMKIHLNSAYGALLNKGYRWNDIRLGESITKTGQTAVKWVMRDINIWINDKANTKGIDYCIAADTDSNMFTIAALIDQTKPYEQQVAQAIDIADNQIKAVISKSFKNFRETYNHREMVVSMEREVVGDAGIFVGKKRYAINVINLEGIPCDPPYQKITGIDAIKSSTPRIVREALKKSIHMALTQEEADLRRFVADFKAKFMQSPFEDIATPKSVNGIVKYHDDYRIYGSKCPIHVRGSLLYNDLIQRSGHASQGFKLIEEGEKIKYIYLRKPNPLHENVIALPAVYPETLDVFDYMDYNTQFEKTYISPMQQIAEVLDWDLEEKPSLLESMFEQW